MPAKKSWSGCKPVQRRYYLLASRQSVRGESFDADAYASPCDDSANWICSQANAQTQCPELTRLRSEAVEASKPLGRARALISHSCEAYIRSSMAWGAMVQYANDHREMCDISFHSLGEFEKYHREAVTARDNVCAGRPIRPFPPDIIQH
jgi:hypothetical protein